MKGVVIEVYIPDKENIYNCTSIGFRVKTNDSILTIEEEQDNYNITILKNDNVVIYKKGEVFSLVKEEDYE